MTPEQVSSAPHLVWRGAAGPGSKARVPRCRCMRMEAHRGDPGIATHIESVSSRAGPDTDRLLSAMLCFCWPGGSGDRTEPAAREWVRRWGPRRAGAIMPVCSCAADAVVSATDDAGEGQAAQKVNSRASYFPQRRDAVRMGGWPATQSSTSVDEAGVATITLNDPDTRNALSPELLGGLIAAFERARDDERRALRGARLLAREDVLLGRQPRRLRRRAARSWRSTSPPSAS